MSSSRIRGRGGNGQEAPEERGEKQGAEHGALRKVLVVGLIVFVCVTMLVPYFAFR